MDWPAPGQHVNKLLVNTVWSSDHPILATLEALREQGDDAADAAVIHLTTSSATTSNLIEAYHKACGTWRPHVASPPPPPLRPLHTAVCTVPAWVDWQLVSAGQAVFWRYWLPVLQALFHCSLVGGFGAPQITAVLLSTGYLSGSAVKRRLAETTHFVVGLMQDVASLRPGGAAWATIVNVRLMHARVRVTLLRKHYRRRKGGGAYDPGTVDNEGLYDRHRDGVAINQEDMIATLLSFSWVVVSGVRRMGIPMTDTEAHALLHLWRWVGWVMGVDPHHCPLREGPLGAERWTDAIVLHLVRPSDPKCVELANHTLHSVAGPAPLPYLHAVTRAMLGPDWADAYALPPTPLYWRLVLWLQRACVRVAVALEWLPGVAAWRRRSAAGFVERITDRMKRGGASFAASGKGWGF